MDSIFGGNSEPARQPTPTPAPPSTDDAAVSAEAAAKERGKIQKGKGYASTILTSGAGDTTEAPTAKKTILGA